MSVGALGSFAQGLVQGYRIGDDMNTAETRRKYITQQTALDEQKTEAAKMEIQRKREIDEAGKELAAAAKEIMPGLDGSTPGGAIYDPAKAEEKNNRWTQAYTNYIGKAKPEALEALRIGRKEESLKDYARGVTQTVAGLMNGDPNALAGAKNLYGYVPDGFEIDPSQSAFEKDPNGKVLGVNFALRNSETGAVQMVKKTPAQLHQLAFAGLMRPEELLTSVDREARREETERYHKESADIRRDELEARRLERLQRNAERGEQRRQFDVTREDRMWQDYTLNGLRLMQNTLDAEVSEIKSGRIGTFKSPEQQEAAINQLTQRRALAENAYILNSNNRIRTSPSDMLEAARQAQAKTLALTPIEDGKGGYRKDYGRLPSGAYFPIPPGYSITK